MAIGDVNTMTAGPVTESQSTNNEDVGVSSQLITATMDGFDSLITISTSVIIAIIGVTLIVCVAYIVYVHKTRVRTWVVSSIRRSRSRLNSRILRSRDDVQNDIGETYRKFNEVDMELAIEQVRWSTFEEAINIDYANLNSEPALLADRAQSRN